MNQEEYVKDMEETRKANQIKDQVLFTFMSKEARERYRRVELVHPELAGKALMTILEGIQRGKLRSVDDNLLKTILGDLSARKESGIVRK